MNDESFNRMLGHIRARADADMGCRYDPGLVERYKVERNARVVAAVLDVLGANVPEARQLVGQTQDLVNNLRMAEEVTPALQQFL